MAETDRQLEQLLVAISDTKLMLGYHYGEWTFGPPALEAGIAACSMAQEEFGHTRLLHGILKREFDRVIDPLADERASNELASVQYLDHRFAGWADVVAANLVVDQAMSFALSAFAGSSFAPVGRIIEKMMLEEKFHYAHAEGWVRVIEDGGGARREHLHNAVARAVAATIAFFGPPGHDAAVVDSGIQSSDHDTLRQRLLERVAGLFSDPEQAGLVRRDDRWEHRDGVAWDGWSAERRRTDTSGPDQEILDELRGTKNVAFKSA